MTESTSHVSTLAVVALAAFVTGFVLITGSPLKNRQGMFAVPVTSTPITAIPRPMGMAPTPAGAAPRASAWVGVAPVARPSAALRAEPTSGSSADADFVLPGCMRYKVTLKKPMGLVLEEDTNGGIWVAEIVPEGNADKDGTVKVGDQLIATSAVVRTTEAKYGEATVYGGEQRVRVPVLGEKFDTIMAAISTNPASQPPTLELQRCEGYDSRNQQI
uniref:PDZ domain-containing protein n=1 Tax=Eutreptiella gymnastica TaxID=73025 RepID=A0A7S1J6Z2_9EUGL|mmetsp:Transcript_72771/g.128225  ORF Transcript_72771/g.128225 Transcript_72771/m.128225 type:complete len:217 (+) Transcript_72771:62-712(+)